MAKPAPKAQPQTGKKKLLAELEELSSKLGIRVRYEVTQAKGGLCTINGEQCIIIDRKAADDYRIAVIAASLKKLDLSEMYVSPKIRDLLDSL